MPLLLLLLCVLGKAKSDPRKKNDNYAPDTKFNVSFQHIQADSVRSSPNKRTNVQTSMFTAQVFGFVALASATVHCSLLVL